jgi:hypothetical protein
MLKNNAATKNPQKNDNSIIIVVLYEETRWFSTPNLFIVNLQELISRAVFDQVASPGQFP